MPDDDLWGLADLDFDRARRRGYPEAVYSAGKTPRQLAAIARATKARAEELRAAGNHVPATLFTRLSPEGLDTVVSELPDATVFPDAALAIWPPDPPAPTGRPVVVACAGTSDLPVATEAAQTARYLGRDVTVIADVGVAGLHRLLKHLPTLREAGVIVVVAGMDGALPSVVAGLVSAPVVACPTSVGYGASFGGVAALLTMLNACAPGVGVVNIDNGYGAGHLAAQIAAPPPDKE